MTVIFFSECLKFDIASRYGTKESQKVFGSWFVQLVIEKLRYNINVYGTETQKQNVTDYFASKLPTD